MSHLRRGERGFEELVGHKLSLKPNQPPITQIVIFEKSGRCLLWIGSRGEDLNEDMVASLLTALCGFSLEALGLELTEVATKQKRIFLAGTKLLIVAIMTNEELITDNKRIQVQIYGLMNRILEMMSVLEEYSGESHCVDDPTKLGSLRYEIEMEITRKFPTRYLNSDGYGLDPSDLPKLRILTYMWDQSRHTVAKIAEDLRLPRFVIAENLNHLEEKGLISPERVQFGKRNLSTYRISELGKLILNQIEGTFPGLWQ
ncbi:MAG: hypothetical protein ACFFCW_06265 [Candidatus Hodarchaeota archaeon]